MGVDAIDAAVTTEKGQAYYFLRDVDPLRDIAILLLLKSSSDADSLY